MSVRLRCPECSASVVAPDQLLGKTVRCPKCRETFLADENLSTSGIRQSPDAASSAPALAASGRRQPADKAEQPQIRRKAPVGLILGIAAGAGVLVLLLAICGGLGAWLLWPRASAGPAPVAMSAESPAPQVQPPAAENAPPPPPAPADNTPFHLGDVRRSVVFIRRSTPGLSTATGTGFFVSADGLIATNRHVIQPASGPNPATALYVGVPSAADPDVLDYFKAQVAFCPPPQDTLDFALLKIAARPGYQAFRPLPLAPAATKLDLGAPVAAIGFPFAAADKPVLSFNKGSISATRRDFDSHPFYQTDAAVNPGNSGGPLINADGQAVGVVSLKLDDANNMGYALYLSETGLPGLLNQDKVARLQPEAGPLDPKQLPVVGSAKPTHRGDWQITRGTAVEEKGFLIAENGGGSYWLTHNDPLPENFQLSVECYVAPLLPDRPQLPFGPRRPIGPQMPIGPIGPMGPLVRTNTNLLRSLYVRFGTDDLNDDIATMGGTTVHMAAGVLQVAENKTVVATERKGVPDEPFMLTVTRRGDELTVAVDGDVWARQKLQRALPGSHKFSIGGLQSGLILRAASAAPVDGPAVPPPLAAEPPKPPAAPPPAPPPEDAKAWAAAPPAGWKGPEWTTDLDKMKFPDGAASGWLLGGEFKADSAAFNIGFLTIRQGQAFQPGGSITLTLPQKSLNDLEGKTLTVAGKQEIASMIWLHAGRTTEEKRSKTQIFGEYSMKLEFGKAKDGKLPGKIYLCLPDDGKSVVAGTFELESK